MPKRPKRVDKPTGFIKRKLRRWVRRVENNRAQVRLFEIQEAALLDSYVGESFTQ